MYTGSRHSPAVSSAETVLTKVVKLGAFFETVKKSDVDALAAHALDPSKAWIAILEPEEKD